MKIVAPLLTYLPRDLTYSVIFLQRDLDEILASQRDMLIRRGQPPRLEASGQQSLREEYRRLNCKTLAFLDVMPNARVLVLERNQLLDDPFKAAEEIKGFLGTVLSSEGMAAQVDRSLQRHSTGGLALRAKI